MRSGEHDPLSGRRRGSSQSPDVVSPTIIDPLVSITRSHPLSSSGETQIRHAGRAHVRGKIRRVWRPRYLELWENGWIRYYEEDDSRGRIARYTLVIFEARILDVTTFRDMHVGLPTSTYGFMFRGQRLLPVDSELVQCSPDGGQPQQRDFLCAVASLEEAQMWVVALQWAASQNNCSNNPSRTTPWVDPRRNEPPPTRQGSGVRLSTSWEPVREEEDGMLGVRVLESCTLDPLRDPQVQQSGAGDFVSLSQPRTGSGMSLSTTSERRIPDPPLRQSRAAAASSATVPAKVVVSRVVQYRTVRLAQSVKFEIAYEIRNLLVQRRQHAEQWSLLRSADDFMRLFQALRFPPDDSRRRSVIQLPKLQNQPTSKQLEASLSIVDSVLRTLVVDAKAVNSSAFKQFLGLTSVPPETLDEKIPPLFVRWWNGHDGKSILSKKVSIRMDDRIPTDQFVKEWLRSCKTPQSTVDANAAQALQIGRIGNSLMPQSTKSTVLLASALLPLASRFWKNQAPTVSLRLDVLVLSWVGAAYIGSTVLSSNQQPKVRKRSPDDQQSGAVPQTPKQPPARRVPTTVVEGSETFDEEDGEESDGEETEHLTTVINADRLPSPLPKYPSEDGHSCWCQPDANIFHVRGATYLKDRIKIVSGPAPLVCRGVDVWMTENPERHIARHPSVLGGKLNEEDTFLVNFLLPFGNLVAYFSIPPIDTFPLKLQTVWKGFKQGDQQYRDARLKLLPVVVEGPWIVKAAVGPGKSPALLGKVIPLQYFFRDAEKDRKSVYEVDVIITASSIAKGILSVVKGHTKAVSIAFAFIIEGTNGEELPENVLCCFQINSLHLEKCPILPSYSLDEIEDEEQ